MNPLFDAKFLIPDGEAHVMPDGRLYLYGSQDIYGKGRYCSYEYRVFSCSDSKLENWTEHGISFQNHPESGQVYWNPEKELFAPDLVCKNNKYYLYFCGPGGYEGVATSDKPEGPFINPKPIDIADGDAIDPAVFVDDDGSVYYFWGQYELRGARLLDDMCTIDTSTLNRCILSEPEHGFHEGASIRKRDGKYYLVYCDISRGRASCLSYAVADHPLGPYKKRGVIIDNTLCDPENWNNHGSIECYKGQWYVFYHRACNGTKYCRRACTEPIFFDANGDIKEVEMTSNGASDPLNAFETIPASCGCRMYRDVHIHVAESDGNGGEIKEWITGKGGKNIVLPWVEYKYLNFQHGANKCSITIKGKCSIRLRTVNNYVCGTCVVSCDQVQTYTFTVRGLQGILPIWFDFSGDTFEFYDFKFE